MAKVRTRAWRGVVLGCVAVALGMLMVGCGGGGGSGSTGLVTSEGAVIDDVRREGTCGEFDGAPYCATDSPNAVAPGGQSLSLVSVTPTPVQTPTPTPHETQTAAPEPTETPIVVPTTTSGSGPTPTSGGQASSTPSSQRTRTPTPARTATPARSATPARTGTPKPGPTSTAGGGATVSAVVNGFDKGAACAAAARPAGSEDQWKTADLVPVDDSGAAVSFPLPSVSPPADVTLLCFAKAPDEIPAELGTLTDADPTVVFVLPSSQ
jgi:hypothetical protein